MLVLPPLLNVTRPRKKKRNLCSLVSTVLLLDQSLHTEALVQGAPVHWAPGPVPYDKPQTSTRRHDAIVNN
ncbi:hypothetical protein F2P81_024974 [Scophthalmus maximus]|uniref:Uncharacterized protein n=1 Tax=Scophthalmus maximus TaxID=52904 RepID=A0A6A4RMB0_SCOMX|nr:hypothetical protein F2P81_024974 [Scophthalmus maximus]